MCCGASQHGSVVNRLERSRRSFELKSPDSSGPPLGPPPLFGWAVICIEEAPLDSSAIIAVRYSSFRSRPFVVSEWRTRVLPPALHCFRSCLCAPVPSSGVVCGLWMKSAMANPPGGSCDDRCWRGFDHRLGSSFTALCPSLPFFRPILYFHFCQILLSRTATPLRDVVRTAQSKRLYFRHSYRRLTHASCSHLCVGTPARTCSSFFPLP